MKLFTKCISCYRRRKKHDRKFNEVIKRMMRMNETEWVSLFYRELSWYYLSHYTTYDAKIKRTVIINTSIRNCDVSLSDVYEDWNRMNLNDQFRFHHDFITLKILHSSK